MTNSVKPTPVYLSDDTKHWLQQLARQMGKPEAELIREAVEAYLGQHRALPRSIGIGASNQGDLSERVDELLWQDP